MSSLCPASEIPTALLADVTSGGYTPLELCSCGPAMEKSDLSHHILSRYNDDLERVRTNVLQMGGLVEEQLKLAVEALVEGDSQLGEQVAHGDVKVNAMEVAIDDDCSRILATRSPAASDLRLIVAVIKTITDLERIGDEAEKIGYIGSRLAAVERPADRYRELKHLGRIVAQCRSQRRIGWSTKNTKRFSASASPS
jgi:phosphate transport system protein